MIRARLSNGQTARNVLKNVLGFAVALWLGVTLAIGWCEQFGGCGRTFSVGAGVVVGVWLFIAVRIALGAAPRREQREREHQFAMEQELDRLARELRDERERTEWQHEQLALCNAQIERLTGRKVLPAVPGKSEPEAFTFR